MGTKVYYRRARINSNTLILKNVVEYGAIVLKQVLIVFDPNKPILVSERESPRVDFVAILTVVKKEDSDSFQERIKAFNAQRDDNIQFQYIRDFRYFEGKVYLVAAYYSDLISFFGIEQDILKDGSYQFTPNQSYKLLLIPISCTLVENGFQYKIRCNY